MERGLIQILYQAWASIALFINHRAHREIWDFKRFSSKLSAVSVVKIGSGKTSDGDHVQQSWIESNFIQKILNDFLTSIAIAKKRRP